MAALVSLVLVLAAALALSSCAGADQEGSPAHRMSVWVNGTGFGEDIGTLVADNARIAKVAPNGAGALHAACSTMINDAEMANSSLPSPDPTVTDLLTQAYGLEGTAGNDCYNGATDHEQLVEVGAGRHQGRRAVRGGDPAHPRHRRQGARDHDDVGQHRQLRDRGHLRMTPDRPAPAMRRRARSPPPPGPVGTAHRPVPRREPRRRRGQPDDGQPGRAGVPGAQAGGRGARARLGHGAARGRGGVLHASRCWTATIATSCAASSSR